MSYTDVLRLLTAVVGFVNVVTLLYRARTRGRTWNTKTIDAAWVFGLWSGTAFLAQLDLLTGGHYAGLRATLVLAATILTGVMLFRRYDDARTTYGR